MLNPGESGVGPKAIQREASVLTYIDGFQDAAIIQCLLDMHRLRGVAASGDCWRLSELREGAARMQPPSPCGDRLDFHEIPTR
jgi:hypothetical protein